MVNKQLQKVNKEEALQHLVKKEKYDVLMKIWQKTVVSMKRNSERVTFYVGEVHRSYPAILVKPFSNIKSHAVRVDSTKYGVKEIETLMDILINLPSFVCSGVFTDYTDWKGISSFVNIMELADLFDMTEVKSFLKSIVPLLTEYNRNAIDIETKRREQTLNQNEIKNKSENLERLPMKQLSSNMRGRSRSKSRTRSIADAIKRSLSRSKKPKD